MISFFEFWKALLFEDGLFSTLIWHMIVMTPILLWSRWDVVKKNASTLLASLILFVIFLVGDMMYSVFNNNLVNKSVVVFLIYILYIFVAFNNNDSFPEKTRLKIK